MAYQRVVVALDVFAAAADTVIRRARQVCGDARLEAVHVVDINHWYLGDHHLAPETTGLRDEVTEEANRRLEALCSQAGIEHRLLVSIVSIVPPLEHSYASAVYADVSAELRRKAEAHVNAHLDALAGDFPVTGERLARWGNPGREIRTAAEELSADLVVVGTHGRHGLGLLLGSTANAVLHGAQTDVLAVRVASAE